MILILSTHADYTTDLVIKWLIHYKYEFIRINDIDFIENEFYYELSNNNSLLKFQNIDFTAIKAVWYRRFNSYSKSSIYKDLEKKRIPDNLNMILFNEYKSCLNLFLFKLRKKPMLSKPDAYKIDKVIVQEIANEIGFQTPRTFIINRKKNILSIDSTKGLINKGINVGYSFIYKKEVYNDYTKEVENIDNLPDCFFLSLLQEKIEKLYEIRTFFLNGIFYSMAIFSQSNSKTKLDFRKYDLNNPNKISPYKLPFDIESKITLLMKELDLDNGSIDIIKDIEGNYIFLEVNPIGQFGMVSKPCNYNIEKKIAKTLINMTHECK